VVTIEIMETYNFMTSIEKYTYALTIIRKCITTHSSYFPPEIINALLAIFDNDQMSSSTIKTIVDASKRIFMINVKKNNKLFACFA
jgi:hypothetical protein